jgi:GNAT superfamily N-acetyltransferase
MEMDSKGLNSLVFDIRRLQIADAGPLAHFYNSLGHGSKSTFRPIGPITIPEKCAEIAVDNTGTGLGPPVKYDIIALLNGELIGWSFLWELDTSTPTFGLAVADAYQWQGVGKALITSVMQWARNRALPEVHLTVVQDNEVAWKLYQKYGFVKTGEFTGDDGLLYFAMVAKLTTPLTET